MSHNLLNNNFTNFPLSQADDIWGATIEGLIPSWIGENLNNLSNKFDGKIPRKIGKLAKLEVLDLSHNKINGEILINLAEEKFLPVLNYKHSMLLHLPRILDLICGSPLSSSCSEDDDGESSHVSASNLAQDDNGGEWFDLSWFYKRIGDRS
ncbi:hypothetical protein F8388_024776 [Cannabis sativa]|uniref:Uncharacterized protein n=1 Tax=Cannabis sativa TaxID=3483 RepID=A0A7J6DNT1_CANSA|nr:hypothetical protein G4B88_015448 [Cannabis sativa]KAF4351444.1 hypothetical protein F8388_024776 [Cannabis sativa]